MVGPPVIPALGKLRRENQEFKARTGGLAQVAECLLCKCEALSSTASTTKMKKKKVQGQPGLACLKTQNKNQY
jgi:primosomal protein N''